MVGFVLAVSMVIYLLYSRRRHGRSRTVKLMNWSDIACKLQPVHDAGILTLARQHLLMGELTPKPATDEAWEMIGGAEGLRRMRDNADTLLALAVRAQIWEPEQGKSATVWLKRDILVLRRAICGAGLSRILSRSKPHTYLHEAASAYYLMTQRLLPLYEQGPTGYTRRFS